MKIFHIEDDIHINLDIWEFSHVIPEVKFVAGANATIKKALAFAHKEDICNKGIMHNVSIDGDAAEILERLAEEQKKKEEEFVNSVASLLNIAGTKPREEREDEIRESVEASDRDKIRSKFEKLCEENTGETGTKKGQTRLEGGVRIGQRGDEESTES